MLVTNILMQMHLTPRQKKKKKKKHSKRSKYEIVGRRRLQFLFYTEQVLHFFNRELNCLN